MDYQIQHQASIQRYRPSKQEDQKNKTTEYIFPLFHTLLPCRPLPCKHRPSHLMEGFYPCKEHAASDQNEASSSLIYFNYFSVLPWFTTTENKHRRLDQASSEIRQLAFRYAYANAKLCQLVKQIDAGWQKSCGNQAKRSLSCPVPTAPHSGGPQSTEGCEV